MTNQIQVGDVLEIKNAENEVAHRITYLGNGLVKSESIRRNMLNGKLEWFVVKESGELNEAQRAYWLANK